jgi:ferredoxin--NADP+ reductase
MTELGTEAMPLRVAIIGAGPSGFYAADALFKSPLSVSVDAFDMLPTPYGLLRGGVAPDHQKMKSVSAYYARVAEKNSDNFRFIGNVCVGMDVTVDELKQYYHALIFSYGAEGDKKTGLPGEALDGVHSAREFVAWYNGHPDFQHLNFDLSQKNVAIIGQGNVAIDVARILAKSKEELLASDITDTALNALSNSAVENIYIIGRRGPVQSAFTELEIREFAELSESTIHINPSDLTLNEANIEERDASNKATKNMRALEDLAQLQQDKKKKAVFVEYFKYPKSLKGVERVTSLEADVVRLEGEAFNQKAVKTGDNWSIPAGLVFRSIGYKGKELPGVPFDSEKGVIPNDKGRILDTSNQPLLGMYTSGWIKRGPSGVLGTNKPCSTETVDSLLNDVSLLPSPLLVTSDICDLLDSRGVRTVSFDDWKIIDAFEINNGKASGKPREKCVSREEIFSILDTQKVR